MANSLFAIIVENPEVPNSSDFIGEDTPIFAKNLEESREIIDGHIFDIIESQNPLGHVLKYSVVPWFGNDFGDPVLIKEKKGYSYKEYVPKN